MKCQYTSGILEEWKEKNQSTCEIARFNITAPGLSCTPHGECCTRVRCMSRSDVSFNPMFLKGLDGADMGIPTGTAAAEHQSNFIFHMDTNFRSVP